MTQPSTAHVCRILGQLNRSLDDVDKTLASGVSDLALDFSTCTFVSVEGLEWLEELLLRADSLKANVTFQNVPPTIYKVFKVAHIDSIARACGSPSSAAGTSAC
jgi:hypothetical protein